jgi:tricorn protease
LTLSTLSAVLVTAMAAQAPEGVEMRMIRFPAIHGNTIVFTYAGDLWSWDRRGGPARRLTTHPGQEVRPRISPDGTMVAFTGQYDGNNEAYVMPIEGGEPRRLTFTVETDNVIGWAPNGMIMVASSAQSFTNRQQRLWLVDPKGGIPRETKVQEITEGSFSTDGSLLAYTRVPSYLYNWRRYRGGTQGRVSIYDMRNDSYRELPAGRDQNFFPMVVGDSIFYISDRNQNTLNLYRHDLRTRRDTQLTRHADADIRFPSTDGRTIVFERDGYLFGFDIASGNMERFSPRVHSDAVAARPTLRPLGGQLARISISPTAVRVAVEARGNVFSVPVRAGETRNLTEDAPARQRFPTWSPDGQSIAYSSDETGEMEVYIRPQMGGQPIRLTSQGIPVVNLTWSPDSQKILVATRSKELWLIDVATRTVRMVNRARYGLGPWDWSPDSRWIAFVDQTRNGFGSVRLFNVASGQTHEVTDGSYDDGMPAFDRNGRYLYLLSTRTFMPTFGAFEFSLKVQDAQRLYVIPLRKDLPNPLVPPADEEPVRPPQGQGDAQGQAQAGAQATAAQGQVPPQQAQQSGPPEIKIDLDRMQDRMIPLPMPASSYSYIVGANNAVLFYSRGTLARFEMAQRQVTPILTGFAGALDFNPDRTKMAYYAGGNLGVLDVRPGVAIGQGTVDLGGVQAVIDPREEWRQIYWEAWRFLRDNFYDPDMAGVNWQAVGKRYEQYLQYVNHRGDLNYVLGLMVGELGTGHAYVSGGDMGMMTPPIPVGQLGADYEVAGDRIRIRKIYRGSSYEEVRRGPLDEPGQDVREGDYLLAIDGRQVTASMHPNSLLQNKVGRTVVLTVNDRPTMEGARTARVRPIASESALRYTDWVEANRRAVAEASGGRIGYMHVPDTATEGAIEFIRGYYRETDKDAVIVDERWNGGGFIQPWFVDTLARRIRAGIRQRHGEDGTDAVAIEGPKVMLINQYAGSGGDFFPWMFRQQGLGPLIGMRTWGGLVGITGSAPLVDGGSVTAPEFGIFDRQTGRWIAENVGVDPDIEVDMRPDLVARGRDPQLERAIEHLMAELKKPRPPVRRPDFRGIGGGTVGSGSAGAAVGGRP